MTRWSSLGLACLAVALLVGGRLEAGVAMDTDADRKGWSPRQIASGFDSPKNPYRIADYDRIDPEYATGADFKAFNDVHVPVSGREKLRQACALCLPAPW